MTANLTDYQLDFRPLNESPTDAQRKQFRAIYGPIRWADNLMQVIVFVPLMLIIISFAVAISSDEKTGMNIVIGVTLFSLALLVFLLAWRLRLRDKDVQLYNFAVANKAWYFIDAAIDDHNGMFFDNGYDQVIKQSLVFASGVEVGNLQYETGSGKSHSTFVFGFARVRLSRKLPNMVLDATSNNGFFGSNLQDRFSKSQRLDLEGEFVNHFDLYVPDDYKRDALYLLTPDVMQALVNNSASYDIEIVDDSLYLYNSKQFDISNMETLVSVLKSITSIASELDHQTARYKDERVTDGAATVAVSGRRLRRSAEWASYIIIFLALLAQQLIPTIPDEVKGVLFNKWTAIIFFIVMIARLLFVIRR